MSTVICRPSFNLALCYILLNSSSAICVSPSLRHLNRLIILYHAVDAKAIAIRPAVVDAPVHTLQELPVYRLRSISMKMTTDAAHDDLLFAQGLQFKNRAGRLLRAFDQIRSVCV